MSFNPSALAEPPSRDPGPPRRPGAGPHDQRPRGADLRHDQSYVFNDAAHAARLFGLQEFGNIYTRIMNPTTDVFEQRVAALEGGVAALGARVRPGGRDPRDPQPRRRRRQHRLSSSTSTAAPTTCSTTRCPSSGIDVKFVDGADPASFGAGDRRQHQGRCSSRPSATRASTSPTSRAIAEVGPRARASRWSSTTPSPRCSSRPIEHGADIVVHSATKWIGGHGTSIGGVVVDGGKFDWAASRQLPGVHRARSELPRPRSSPEALRQRSRSSSSCASRACATSAPALSPFNSFLFLQGLETLPLRIERHSENALAVAQWLEDQPEVDWVSYPGLKSHPELRDRRRSTSRAASAASSRSASRAAPRPAGRLIDSVKLFSLLANVGDAKSLIIHPASTTHQQLTAEEQAATGVTDGPRPPVGGHRAHRRHHRRPRPGAPRRDRPVGPARARHGR